MRLLSINTKCSQIKDSVAKLQKDLDMLVEWADCWSLLFNVDKCKVLHLGQNNPKQIYSI